MPDPTQPNPPRKAPAEHCGPGRGHPAQRRIPHQEPILWTIGIIGLIIGLILLAMGSVGRAVGGRGHYY